VIDISNGRGNNLKMTWNDKSLVFEPLSANLIRLRKTLKPDEKYTLLWNEVDRW
jgi:hypothetical protein